MTRAWVAAAALAALLLVLLGRVIPTPPLVTGEEGSRTTLVTARTDALTERYKFQDATLEYQRFLATHPLGTEGTILPNELRLGADQWEAGGDHTALLAMARDRTRRIIELGHALSAYAVAGDTFLAKLRAYDDDLMSWSRTLGSRSEQLRRSTWPILEWIHRYPENIPGGGGINADLHYIPSAQVLSTTALLEKLQPQIEAPTADSATMRRIALAADDLWVAGRYIPQVDQYHDGYFSALRRYDAESVEVAATPEPALAGRRTILAWAGAVVVGLILFGALLLIFAPPTLARRLPGLPGRRAARAAG
jgi:hypothetical protein